MNINFTLVVQMCNFFVAYGVLRIFFFRPLIAILQQEKLEEKTLLTTINDQQKNIMFQQQKSKDQWITCQRYFTNNRPVPIKQRVIFKNISPSTQPQMTAEHEGHRYDVEIKNALERKIKHVW